MNAHDFLNFDSQPVALVTGSTAGIGRGIALRLAAEGFLVVINGRSVQMDDTTQGAGEVKTAIERAGGKAMICAADVGRKEDREHLMEAIERCLGRLDLLVNNAGVAPEKREDLLAASEDSFSRVLHTNLTGPYFLTQMAARRMILWKQQGIIPQPRIAFISSISAYAASVHRGEYCVSKAGLSMAAQLFAARLVEFDIPVIEIRPGIIETRMTSGVKEKYDHLIAEGLLPFRRWGTPEDVAGVVSAFARGNLDYSTGVAIDISGGFNIRQL